MTCTINKFTVKTIYSSEITLLAINVRYNNKK